VRFLAAIFLAVFLATTPAFGQTPSAPAPDKASPAAPATLQAQETERRQRAEQEALARAFAMLFQRVAELRITPDVRVADFFLANPHARAQAWRELCRITQVSGPQSYSDVIGGPLSGDSILVSGLGHRGKQHTVPNGPTSIRRTSSEAGGGYRCRLSTCMLCVCGRSVGHDSLGQGAAKAVSCSVQHGIEEVSCCRDIRP